jgi:hypothetical protein
MCTCVYALVGLMCCDIPSRVSKVSEHVCVFVCRYVCMYAPCDHFFHAWFQMLLKMKDCVLYVNFVRKYACTHVRTHTNITQYKSTRTQKHTQHKPDLSKENPIARRAETAHPSVHCSPTVLKAPYSQGVFALSR